tara:strand:- start:1823 stop:3526 length:1704 start_codon:yes stop_codon:yes gene_type:complete
MSRARNLGNLGNENLISGDTANLRVGINSTLPATKLDVDGNVTATAFFGDGSNLEGVASAGLGTALSDDGAGSVIYFTNTTLGIGSTVVVDPPSTTKIAYTQYQDISLDENVDLIVEEGDDFVPDILGLSTEGITQLTGIGGRIRAGSFTDKAGTGAPKLTFGAEVPVGVAVTGAGGINVAGFATAGGFVGNITGNVVGNVTGNCSGSSGSATGNAGGLTGTPDIAIRNITGVAATFTGVLTYEDVTNVDSVGIVTARSGIKFGAAGVGGTITGAGAVNIIGISTFESNVEFGQAGVGGTVTALGHAEFVGIVTASGLDAAISVWTLGASGTDHYTFTGPGNLSTTSDPTLQLIRGQKYIFKNRSGGHPFRIQSTRNGSAGTAYNTGVTNNDGGDGTDIVFDVPYDAPSVLYYQCTAHPNMGGVLYIGSSSGYGLKVAGTMVEGMSSTTTAYNTSGDLNITNGNFHFNSANLGGTGTTLNIMSTTGINTTVNVNEVLNVTAVTAVNASTAFVNKVTIDGKATGITTHWVGGSVPTDGGGSGVDTYSFNILKTGSETYIIVANQVKTS